MSDILTTDGLVDISNTEAVAEISDVALFDPHVQVELEHLNNATYRIKKLETELDKARSDFRCLLNESSSKVNNLSKKLGSCVENAKLSRDSKVHAKKWLIEAENKSKLEQKQIFPAHNESEKVVQHLHQELKKSIVKSCLSTRRNLLQLNNLANQHQLQLLPYFEMKAQFNQMFEEQIKKVPPLEVNDLKSKMNDDTQSNIGKTSEEIFQEWKFQDMLGHEERNTHTKASNSMTSSYQDSLSSESIYLELLTSEDTYKDLPPNLKLTPGLVNCLLSNSNNSCLKFSNNHSIDVESSVEDLSNKTSHENFSYNSMLCEDKSNGLQDYEDS